MIPRASTTSRFTPNAIRSNGAHSKLFLAGKPEFPDHEDIQRTVESSSHLESDRDSTPGQS